MSLTEPRLRYPPSSGLPPSPPSARLLVAAAAAAAAAFSSVSSTASKSTEASETGGPTNFATSTVVGETSSCGLRLGQRMVAPDNSACMPGCPETGAGQKEPEPGSVVEPGVEMESETIRPVSVTAVLEAPDALETSFGDSMRRRTSQSRDGKRAASVLSLANEPLAGRVASLPKFERRECPASTPRFRVQ
ncbi:unnamed protein product [Protopolystoma xenopodis]|uniref:Uncharacterized protein n=1 Tax=Protopolystoma xenopodis TaxID=117903 RepID=A0A3S5B022_9PLAT|nr:unnamed protein product [Protopolystoma xenopodis]